MLGTHSIDVMLLATDLPPPATSTDAGSDCENDEFLTFGCGGDSRLVVTRSTVGTADAATKASWRVDDLRAEVADLRSRGVDVPDLPEMGSVDGIVDAGFALAAWFTDPAGNSIGLLQLKE